MLTVLLTILMFSQGLSTDSRGTSFITAFPENIAVYYKKTVNLLKITTLHPNTTVNITNMATGNVTTNADIINGTILTVNLGKEVEEYQFVSSNKSFQITSDQNITVLSMSGWEGRFQSRIVHPEQNLGTVYPVPALNYSKMASEFKILPFRLMIINAVDKDNGVTIKEVDKSGQIQTSKKITLGPYQLFQLQINDTVREINAADKVAVLLTHPCFDSNNCACNMVVNQLNPPVSDDNIQTRFLVPPIFKPKQVLVTTNQPFKVCKGFIRDDNCISLQSSTDILPLFQNLTNSSHISTTVPVSLQLISPGIILDLIPTRMFSGCYLLDFNSSQSGALVIAITSSTNYVRMNDEPLPSYTNWSVLNGTEYSWTLVEAQDIGTIWHPTSKIGVYMIERLDSINIYGSPAITINKDPDRRGCMVTPEMFVLGEDEMTWFMSREYCLKNADQFARLVTEDTVEKMVSNMTLKEPTDGWISLRRGLYSREWYWKNEDNYPSTVNFTYWGAKQPENPEKGLCASVSLDPSKNFMWKSARCCFKKKPLCYKTTKYLKYEYYNAEVYL